MSREEKESYIVRLGAVLWLLLIIGLLIGIAFKSEWMANNWHGILVAIFVLMIYVNVLILIYCVIKNRIFTKQRKEKMKEGE